jgi:hypothetical protein
MKITRIYSVMKFQIEEIYKEDFNKIRFGIYYILSLHPLRISKTVTKSLETYVHKMFSLTKMGKLNYQIFFHGPLKKIIISNLYYPNK